MWGKKVPLRADTILHVEESRFHPRQATAPALFSRLPGSEWMSLGERKGGGTMDIASVKTRYHVNKQV